MSKFFAVLATLRNKRDHIIFVKQNFTVTDPIEVDLSYKVVKIIFVSENECQVASLAGIL